MIELYATFNKVMCKVCKVIPPKTNTVVAVLHRALDSGAAGGGPWDCRPEYS